MGTFTVRVESMQKNAHIRRPSLWIIGILFLFPLTGAIWFGFVSVAPLPIDQWWHDIVGVNQDSLLFSISHFFHVLGSTKGMAVVSALILGLLLLMRKWAHATTLAVTMISVLVASKVIKIIVDRPRPAEMLIIETETSFPSGHSLGAGAIATLLVCFIYANNKVENPVKLVAVILGSGYILIMMWSRTALQVHWLSDTVSGATLGVVLALLFSRIFLFKESLPVQVAGRHAM